ncbi:(deoxy)nucleoside triphosphate pyrophosphohydrolase [Marinoscillum pacificum]|uniref:(deoxy)nucleoside triphosphate pyrophosphohydrolase n=1 Tax=Marinoscillum pacificum TaxID=392723 RepID=UPI002157BCD1|nr:(deoxy)nucleoside triphosphate pyrophosphohydrolase [Marinoscillum pacificum]
MMLEVTCAVIIQNGQLLAAQRKENDRHPLKWELPGGKVEAGESYSACIQRELMEELDIQVIVVNELNSTIHHYPDLSLKLIPLQCEIVDGSPKALIHKEICWIGFKDIWALDWAEADIPILKKLLD